MPCGFTMCQMPTGALTITQQSIINPVHRAQLRTWRLIEWELMKGKNWSASLWNYRSETKLESASEKMGFLMCKSNAKGSSSSVLIESRASSEPCPLKWVLSIFLLRRGSTSQDSQCQVLVDWESWAYSVELKMYASCNVDLNHCIKKDNFYMIESFTPFLLSFLYL